MTSWTKSDEDVKVSPGSVVLTTVSKLNAPGKRRGDAERNLATVLETTLDLLGRGRSPSMAEVAQAAGLTRQTVYAHFPSRQALLAAVTDHLTRVSAEALSEIDPAEGSPWEALERWLRTSWGVIDRFPALLNPELAEQPVTDQLDQHAPIVGGLRAVLARGRRTGDFVKDVSVDWLVAAIIAVGHAAGQEVAAGRLTPKLAGDAFVASALRLCRPDAR